MKKCKDCGEVKQHTDFYGVQGECKGCTKKRIKVTSKNIIRICFVCHKKFGTCSSEIKRGGGLSCSRKCFFVRLKSVVKKDEDSPNWKGDSVGKAALHDWVKRKLGRPNFCEHCKRSDRGLYHWANKSWTYQRNLNDWIRLCAKCHTKYDGRAAWKKTVKTRYGWNVI